MRRSLSDWIWYVISLGFIIFLIPFLLKDGGFLKYIIFAGRKGMLLPVMWIYIGVCFIYILIGKKYVYKLEKTKSIVLWLVIGTIIPRLYILSKQFYVATNDFKTYLEYGKNIYYGDFGSVAKVIATKYQMPKMGGLAVFNGIIARIFSPTLIGYQIASILMCSGIVALIYIILKNYNKTVALTAAFLYMVYPSNIFSSQIPTNHHGATLFFMLAIFVFLKIYNTENKKKIYLYAVLSGILITISNFIHPSVIVIILSILCYSIFIIIGYFKDRKKVIKFLKVNVIMLVLYSILTTASLSCLHHIGIINDYTELPVLFKVVMGLNEETTGGYSSDDINYIKSLPQAEKQSACISIIKERIKNNSNIPELFYKKTYLTWFTSDSYFSWFYDDQKQKYKESENNGTLTEAEQTERENIENWISGVYHLDIIFTHIVYWFSIIGIWLNRKKFPTNAYGVLTFIPMGWICVIMLTERQARYRYPAMPSFMALAALGIYGVYIYYKNKRIKHN